MKLYCMEHTQPKVTCKYYTTKNHTVDKELFFFWEIQRYFMASVQSVFIKTETNDEGILKSVKISRSVIKTKFWGSN